MNETHEEYPPEFYKYVAEHPNEFRPDDPIDVKFKYYTAFTMKRERAISEKAMAAQALDREAQKNSERQIEARILQMNAELDAIYEKENGIKTKDAGNATVSVDAEAYISDVSDEIRVKAKHLLDNPDEYVKAVLEDYRTIHYGDENICLAVLRQQAIQCCPRADGIHLKATGETGTGKSSAFISAYAQSPQEYMFITSASPMALLYDEEIPARSIIMLDDVIPDLQMVDMLKQSITRWREGLERRTVSNQQKKKLKLKPFISWCLTSCENSKDEQLLNRFQEIHVVKDENKSKVIAEFVLQKAASVEPETTIPETRLVIQEAMRQLKKLTFNPIVPRNLKPIRTKETRSIEQLIDNMRANAILHYTKRNPVVGEDGVITITVNKEDFTACISEFQDTNKYELKLSPNEVAILKVLIASPVPMSQTEIYKNLKCSPAVVHNAIIGRKGDDKAATLLERNLVYEVNETEGESKRTSQKKYSATIAATYLTDNFHGICVWSDD